MAKLTTIDDIKRARRALPRLVRRTPIVPLARDAGEIGSERLHLKLENLQVTGAYKPRAAFSMLASLGKVKRSKGVVMTSSGNFAQAFGVAGRHFGCPIVVVMLDSTSAYKMAATRATGAEVFLCGSDPMARQPTVERIAAERGMTAIDTWEEPPITAGHASIGMEIIEDFDPVEQVLVPVSSGGVAAGVASAVKLHRPEVKVIGVQPERANAAYVSRKAGALTTIDYWDTIADGLSARRPGAFPFAHLEAYLDDIVLISEQDIADAFHTLLYRAKVLAEPAGAVASAAFLSGKVDTALRTVATVTGGNLTEEVFGRLMKMAGAGRRRT